MRAEAHADVLRLEEHLVAPGTALAADTRGLGTAEGLAQVAYVLAVDETHAGLDGGRHTMGAPEILAPHIAAQAVLDVIGLGDGIGLVAEGNEARHRSEDLLLGDAHAIVDVGKNAGPDVVAGA